VLNSINVVPLGLFAATLVVAAIFAYLLQTKRQRYLLPWTAAWGLLALHYLIISGETSFGNIRWLVIPDQWTLAAAALAFLYAARMYARRDPWPRLTLALGAGFAFWAVASFLGYLPIAPPFGVTLVFWAAAIVFWQQSQQENTPYDLWIAISFLLRGPMSWISMLLTAHGTMARQAFGMLSFTEEILAGLLMVMAVCEEERWRVERNVLALSNLSLSTSSFTADQMQETARQVLRRVMNAVDAPSGAIFIFPQPAFAAATASAGLDESFCAAAQPSANTQNASPGVMQDLAQLSSRLGGMLVLRDLDRDSECEALEREEGFPAFRQLALAHGLRAPVCVSLHNGDLAFGALLLDFPQKRRFPASELRLMRGLGQQIGLALENSYLLQQTARRSQELSVLNEIGRALSSLLDPDALFEKIFTEIQRLFDVSNFSIALYDPGEDQIRFELQVTDGVRLPKHTRPIGNHLTEYILRTRQPVLIGEQFVEEMHKLGVETEQGSGSFCGVPLLAYERAIGVIAVRGFEEHLYDAQHLELLRVLASEAAIAIENARLFHEQQSKSRQLTLLNNISRDAITTLNPDEMLANIAEQLAQGLSFDHMGIAILDYANKELVVQAEAGRRRGALGLRLAIGDSLVGRVAANGQTCAVPDISAGDPVLADSVSAVALPILYADQLHGVLYMETAERADFSEEQLLLLHTLADLIASALHHALTFQRAQEQAITDGLTGVKTHRFFMEAISAEWKRATRVGRPFCIVLIDLDRFKFVNDFHGHPEGDLVLKRIGHLLDEGCRRSDVVARYGGDEFVILMPETNIEQGLQWAEKLRAAICDEPLLRDRNITASFGVASFPMHGSTPEEILQVADASMYLSKHRGGNAVSAADQHEPAQAREWKRGVLEAYLGVTLKRLFTPGPQAFAEIRGLLEQFSDSLASDEKEGRSDTGAADVARPLPAAVAETVTALALAIDATDHYTQGHSRKVASYCAMVAEQLGLPADEVNEIRLGGLLHDIGKVGVPLDILHKCGPLNPDEWELMKEHARYGDRLLQPITSLGRIRSLVLHHHEMFDGSGYPDALSGREIPLGARIVAIADAFDTITSERTYKKPRTISAALDELQRCAGAQFDPELVRLFVEALQIRMQPVDVSAGDADDEAIH
jgi:diguanylate cyclase (GGDEF)-like protein